MAASEPLAVIREAPQQIDLDRCVHCGLCLNACPTYRELGVEMDSPRGRIYQMVQVSEGRAQINPSYVEHIDLCLACRGCETACPSGVQYGRLVEAARTHIEQTIERPWHVRLLRNIVFDTVIPSRGALKALGIVLYAYQTSGMQKLVRSSGLLKLMGKLGRVEALTPTAEMPPFYGFYGRVLPPRGKQRYRVAMFGGCMANIFFARLNEATVRVLRRNGCEVSIPDEQTCCGALHVHAGLREQARKLAKQNIDGEKAKKFVSLVKDANEFLASIELDRDMQPLRYRVTYQDSCHLAHGQKIKAAPRVLLRSIPGLTFVEMPYSDLCCGSAGVYNIVQDEMAAGILEKKMTYVNSVRPDVIATANPGCMLQLEAGVRKHGKPGQQVRHVIELLDEAYGTGTRGI